MGEMMATPKEGDSFDTITSHERAIARQAAEWSAGGRSDTPGMIGQLASSSHRTLLLCADLLRRISASSRFTRQTLVARRPHTAHG